MIDLDQLAAQYKDSSEYWQRQWDETRKRFSDLKLELQLTRQQWEAESVARTAKENRLLNLIEDIQGALGTEETGDNLVAVAKESHQAQLELYAHERRLNSMVKQI